MRGFKNDSLNQQVAFGILEHIVIKVLECLDLMKRDCERNCCKLANNETKIRDYLFTNYLNNDNIMQHIGFNDFRFSSEVPENYVDATPQGRTDLQVYSIDTFRHRERYFIIECKRIDGNLTLNREYVDKGMRRFTGKTPKYTSYYKRNCMLGFVVRNINIDTNIAKINCLLKTDYTDIHVKDYLHAGSIPLTYLSVHGEDIKEQITLIHLMPNCSSLIS
ncbi:hypothetical protein SDC9_151605 [bioreactor metagenome]|uniref:Uncharacterized protein n=1 Tax=bioreactor metagenome TaxID=1076179 RepID=A0A645EQR8_9ZZZZ|nr:hypothetical protein [Syntrophomonadaceae bacterium]